jgi:hypothetical protein
MTSGLEDDLESILSKSHHAVFNRRVINPVVRQTWRAGERVA